MNTLMQASRQWASRPADERFTSLIDMHEAAMFDRKQSREVVVSTKDLSFKAEADNKVALYGPNGHGYEPSNWAFGQFATHAEAPAGYLRTLPAELATPLLNYGFSKVPDKKVKVLLQKKSNDECFVRAMTGPKYGRVWDEQIIAELMHHYGDGRTGQFRVPGEFGQAVAITKDNTTLYRGDRSMFLFLVDEENRIELPNRRNGKPGSLARGFFIWQSEVSASALNYATFLFDYVCQNRIVWGAEQYQQFALRHTVNAPDKWREFIGEMVGSLSDYAKSSTREVEETLRRAQQMLVDAKFLNEKFGQKTAEKVQLAHMADEGRPIATLWDAVTGATAFARSIPHQDTRVAFETQAGNLLNLAV